MLVTMKAMGLEPTEEGLQNMVVAAGVDQHATGVTLEQFNYVLTDKMENDESSGDELAHAFRIFKPMKSSHHDLARILALGFSIE